MLVPPEKCLLGSKYIQFKGEDKKLVKKFGYFIPLTELIGKLLKLPEIVHFVLNDHRSNTDTMKDVCNGSYVHSHTLSGEGNVFLQFVILYDDLELQNPLRANKTHKLAMFYMTLLNIPPKHRSQLNNIFLLALARTKDVKDFGLDQLLGDFVGTVKKLRNGGINMWVHGAGIKRICGDLIFVVCDTPATSFLAGFKESSFAFKSCRMCTCSGQEMKENFVPETFNYVDM